MSRLTVAAARHGPPSAALTSPDAGPMMKGTAFRSTLRAIEKLYGPEPLLAVKEALDPEARATLDHLLPVSWYPVSVSAALHEAVRKVLGNGSWETSRFVGHEAAKIDYTGVYRVVLRAIQYDSVFSRLELTWRNYYSRGSFRWDHRRPGFTRLTITDVQGFNPGMWIACAGRAESLLKLTGARAAEVAVKDPGDRSVTMEAMWFD